jgi:hypothetical protein
MQPHEIHSLCPNDSGSLHCVALICLSTRHMHGPENAVNILQYICGFASQFLYHYARLCTFVVQFFLKSTLIY